jgi:beta-lactamase class A
MKALLILASFLLIIGGVVIYKLAIQKSNVSSSQSSNNPSVTTTPAKDKGQLSEALKNLCDTSGGKVSVAVVHIETGNSAEVDASNELPLFSVFKLPLALAVLKNVEEGRLTLDQNVHIGPDELAVGTRANSARWQKPVDFTIKQLLEFSIIESDNTSSEKLLQLVGGPQAVTERMHSFDLQHIDIRTNIKDYVASRSAGSGVPTRINTGSALGLVKLLSGLQRGELLQPAQTELLIGMMERAKTGLRRLRGNLPPGTKVADKTGSGDLNPKTNFAISTNDVGLITLPDNRGHLAIAVLLHDSTLTDAQQEKLIADLARAAFDVYSSAR